jgi:hypothetical protein
MRKFGISGKRATCGKPGGNLGLEFNRRASQVWLQKEKFSAKWSTSHFPETHLTSLLSDSSGIPRGRPP